MCGDILFLILSDTFDATLNCMPKIIELVVFDFSPVNFLVAAILIKKEEMHPVLP